MRMIVGFLRKALVLQVRFTLTASPTPQSLHFLPHHFYPFSSSSTSISTSERSESFTVSYLIDSCGLSHKDALSASKLLRFETPEKPDSVLAFFNSHGFSKSQTSKIVKSLPRLLASDPDKTLLPKLQFFYSKGASKPDVAKIVVSTPGILKRSLENQIIPSFNFLKDFLQSDEMAITVVKRFSRILLFDLHTYVASNMNALQEFGVPKSNIAGLLMYRPMAFMVNPNLFRKNLEEVKKMGFNPSQMKFVLAIQAMRAGGESCWERKIDIYKKWGWSEEEIRLAFTKSPWCMIYSEDKIMAKMDFFVNKMGRESSLIAHRPFLIGLSLEKRIIPRYSVVQVLLSKGLINKDISLVVLFESTEKTFLERFVNAYKEEAPQLIKLYQEKINL
ncbi:hypothetical protein VitviT2T_006350 [Vitis vinifera]|uniref:Uncharacterized protein n=1 Tax=Vitis vinifera TaxID=29760 RepID=A0ABY9BVJ5_VITVI|nr:transcription termination factor MTERF5, chloroplastic [Vitis vinifera]WJZ86937.1 hypothetical protein VitviT2T_006350 [Vitis vinifera]|eukprot:XP_010649759.1 PREDICTED: transcription termination factor MTERF5, chloroplastic-like [Vitis vinifera]